ncbi:MAG: DUF1501 domain-containing protein [Bryobacterales bacterium]|nr:DUF1501 domain-containing protein [Bryobacterales bacterium]MEB2360445.1 DUF1501 domain-containing protein [Bryobacterales bacterium]
MEKVFIRSNAESYQRISYTLKYDMDAAHHFSRRDLLRLGSGGLIISHASNAALRGHTSCIVVWMGGGCSHLDTFDMKPEAPREIRGEFKPVRTSSYGVQICEHLPLTAKIAHKFAIIRSMTSDEPNHERATARLWTGLNVWQCPPAPLSKYCRVGDDESSRVMVIDAGTLHFDTHNLCFSSLREHILPRFDRLFSRAILSLDERGLLDSTLVLAMGEFGRTPRINREGGRDHYSRCWSILVAGGGIPGGRVIGATDRLGENVITNPITPEDIASTMHAFLGSEKKISGRAINWS